jgi:hypothetical protein
MKDKGNTKSSQSVATQQQTEVMQTASVYLTVKQFCDKHKAFAVGGMRAIIFNEHQNGLAKSGAIIRIGRKVLIDEAKFFVWVESQNKAVA